MNRHHRRCEGFAQLTPEDQHTAQARPPGPCRRDRHRQRGGLARRQERAAGSRSRAGRPGEGGCWSALVVGPLLARAACKRRERPLRGRR
jgi:hypothetical protein